MNTTTPLRLLIIAAASICGALMFRDFFAERIYVATASMEPTMPVNSRWWVDKVTLRLWGPAKGEVVVLASPVNAEKGLIKRVIAVGGDTIEIRDKVVYINGAQLQEKFVQHTRADEILRGDNLEPLKVPDDHVFLMGDNRDESGDSRDWKDPKTGKPMYFIPIQQLRGRILGVRTQ